MSSGWKALAEKLLDAHTYFLGVAGKLDVALRDQGGVCGKWSPREVIAHLVGWDAEAVRGFGLFASDQADAFVPVANEGIHDFNAASVHSRRDLSWNAVVDELKATQQALQDLIKVVDAKGFNAEGGFGEWLVGRQADYEHHTQQLLVWVSEG